MLGTVPALDNRAYFIFDGLNVSCCSALCLFIAPISSQILSASSRGLGDVTVIVPRDLLSSAEPSRAESVVPLVQT